MTETYLRDINDKNGILACYEEYGAVGITNVLSKSEINATITDIENIVKSTINNDKFTFNDPYTYSMTDIHFNSHGVIGKCPLFSPQLVKNRYHPNVKKAYSILYQLDSSNLLPQHDRVSWMRPTYGSNYEDYSKYRVVPNIHLDVDPRSYFDPKLEKSVYEYLNNISYSTSSDLIKENNVKCKSMGRQLQGILNLFDNDYQDGGFCFVPRGHKMLENWYIKHKNNLPTPNPNGRYVFSSSDKEFYGQEVRLPCPAGTLIVFDAILPHGTQPNYSQNQRMIQFIRYIPKHIFSNKTLTRRTKLVCSLLEKYDY